MQSRLVLERETETEGQRKLVEDTLFYDLPMDCKVYLFYHMGGSEEFIELEDRLKEFGRNTGSNLLVASLLVSDPNYQLIAELFDLSKFPIVVITAHRSLATLIDEQGNSSTPFMKITSRTLLKDADRAMNSIETIFTLFMRNKISEAIKQGATDRRNAIIILIKDTVIKALKGLEVTISVFPGVLDLKMSGK